MRTGVALALMTIAMAGAEEFTRGIGVYPGDPRADFSPLLKPGGNAYRNIARNRPAFHSSSYDYNLTAQLITDGIKATAEPRWIAVSTSQQGVLKKNQREWSVDRNWVSATEVAGKDPWIQFEFGGEPYGVDGLRIDASVKAAQSDNQQWTIVASTSADGQSWTQAGLVSGMARPSGEVHAAIAFAKAVRARYHRLQFFNARPLNWQVGEIQFLAGGKQLPVGGPYEFTSAWMSAGGGEQWVYVDLGAKSSFDRVALAWIRKPAEGALEVSDDAKQWRRIRDLDSSDMKFEQPVEARYVRVRMTRPESGDRYALAELEVFGRGGLVAEPKPAPAASGNRQLLAAGAWKLTRDSQTAAGGVALSTPGFADAAWLPATVPGTVLVSYWNAGALPDPNFGENQLMISDTFFHSDFWYRNEFPSPKSAPGQRVWLNFDGINWKAEVWLNGAKLGRIEGGFTRARFDVTGKLKPAGKNALAVRIEKNATPGSVKEKTFENPDKNGGALGADNPTYHASIGWDWIPTIRGRNTGIWNDVYLSTTGTVTVEDPLVSTVLSPDNSRADVTIEALVRNHSAAPVKGAVRFKLGELNFEQEVSLAASSSKTVKHTLAVTAPNLWWPNGYGEPNLYNLEVGFGASDVKRVQVGLRQFRYSEEGGALRIWINGRRFVPRGGNWGFGESMLRYRGREYETAMRYHRDLNFNMIRNWVGQIGDDELYEAADRNGIVIMQDFWLANPWDGPDPNDNRMFMANARDTISRIRHHASVGLYCGRNEGYPLKPLDDSIRASLKELHPGIHYIGSSADDVVSGHGPYRAQGLKQYFTQRATPKFHSEMGMPNIVTMDSLREMMPEDRMWPQGGMWGLHDFCLQGAQGGASFIERIDRSYGGAKNVEEWVALAQFVNYEGHRAMFEAQSKNRMGLLIWMSHPAWPSMVWQTYDYYFDTSAAYYGAKKGSEPLHIQWNPATDQIEVVNYNAGNATGLTAMAELLDLDGSRRWQKFGNLDSPEDSVKNVFAAEFPSGLSPAHFLRLTLSRGSEVVSTNFYWRGTEDANFQALRGLAKAAVSASTEVAREGERWLLTTTLRNTSKVPALMVRVKPVRETSRDRILPALNSDNYVALMPGETTVIRTELKHTDTRGEKPAVVVEGFNLQ